MIHLNTKKYLLGIFVASATLVGLYGFAKTDLYAQTGAMIAAAGDICPSNGGGGCTGTSNIIMQLNPNTVLALGDNQYPDGTLAQYMAAYNNSWGRFKAKTRPVPGNHEYHAAGAPGYYDYWGSLAGTRGQGYYSYNLGGWHMIALNSEAMSTTQTSWLDMDLNANRNTACTLAYWHSPRWSSGQHGSNTKTAPFWDKLYQYKADLVLVGHDHTYERFAPMNPSGQAVADGVREFVVGTGGAGLYSLSNNAPNSQFKQNSQHGVLKLTLNATSYSWQFITTSNQVIDSGTGNCVGGGGPGPTGMPTMGMTMTPTRMMTGMMRKPGDVDGNGLVNILDFQALSNSFGKSQGMSGYNPNANFNGDTMVNILDFQILSNNFGR